MKRRDTIAHVVGQPVPALRSSAPRVQRTKVPCPTCGAPVGEQCASLKAGRQTGHESRRRMALRAGYVERP